MVKGRLELEKEREMEAHTEVLAKSSHQHQSAWQ